MAVSELSLPSKPTVDQPDLTQDERMIWELTIHPKQNYIDVRPFVQKQSGRKWTKGRPIALHRIYDEHTRKKEFDFLSEQDIAICRTLEDFSSQNRYGYFEECYCFDSEKLAQAISRILLVLRRRCRFTASSAIVDASVFLLVPHRADTSAASQANFAFSNGRLSLGMASRFG